MGASNSVADIGGVDEVDMSSPSVGSVLNKLTGMEEKRYQAELKMYNKQKAAREKWTDRRP